MPPIETLKSRLESLLKLIPKYISRAEEAASKAPEHVRALFARDGPLGILQFWRANRANIEDSSRALLDTGESALRGNSEAFRDAANRVDLSWLPFRRAQSLDGSSAGREEVSAEQLARNVTLCALDALTPWDFDRHDFGLTFANTWIDADALGVDGMPGLVKLTSTINVLEREWKVSARTKLLEIGKSGVVFGKAGMYLAGERPAYIGVEADRIWSVKGLPATWVFANVNYRSSRKPATDPVRASFGVQQELTMFKGVVLTLRVGYDPMTREKWFVTPMPNREYF